EAARRGGDDGRLREAPEFTGNNLKNIVESPAHEGLYPNPGRYCFRLEKNRVYYVSEALVKRATNISRKNLVAMGTCVGRFTHGGKFTSPSSAWACWRRTPSTRCG
ncbi:unnamed protein product, partial [Linum tenue]